MFEPKEEKKKEMPVFCPLIKARCQADCAWLLEDDDEFQCSIQVIGCNS